MDENFDNIITLNDENGDEVRFEFLDLWNMKGRSTSFCCRRTETER